MFLCFLVLHFCFCRLPFCGPRRFSWTGRSWAVHSDDDDYDSDYNEDDGDYHYRDYNHDEDDDRVNGLHIQQIKHLSIFSEL